MCNGPIPDGWKEFRDINIPKAITLLVQYRDEETELSTQRAAIDEIIDILQENNK
jgi:hypothetical protein